MDTLRRFEVAFTVFTLGTFLDVLTTIHIIQHPSFVEGNPLVQVFIDMAGASGIFALKFGVYIGAIGVMIAIGRYTEERVVLMTYVFGIVWLIASLWNAYLFLL